MQAARGTRILPVCLLMAELDVRPANRILPRHPATLEVRRSNEAARRLYERLGFTVTGTRSNYYTNPIEDALILWREDPG